MLQRRLTWLGLEQTAWMTVSFVAVVLALVLIVLLLRYERTLVPRRIGRVLLGFRLIVLGLLLLVLLEPVLSWRMNRAKNGRLVVAVDLSDSMTTIDQHASPAEKLRWARALGLIGNDTNNDRLDRWIRAYDAGREPQWVDESESVDGKKRDQLAIARQEHAQNLFAEIDKVPRKEIVRRILQSTGAPLLAELGTLGNLEVFVFGGKAINAEPDTIEQFTKDPPAAVQTAKSDLAQALVGATTSDAGEEEGSLLGIVLLTDGRDNGGSDLLALAERFTTEETRIFPVIIGSEQLPPDLSVVAIESPQSISKGDTPLVTANLSCIGFAGKELEVRLLREQGEPVIRKVVPKGQTAEVQFPLETLELGRHRYSVSVAQQPGEARDDNNSRSFAVNVVDDKIHVLLVDGEARWEFRYLDNALARDANIAHQSVLFRQPYMGVLDSTYFRRDLGPAVAPGKEQTTPFSEQDVVILGDISPEDLSQETWQQLEQFVSEEGGTLVCVAGKQHFPLEFNSPILERLLPVTKLRAAKFDVPAVDRQSVEEGFQLVLTLEGQKEAMFQFDSTVETNREVWSALPGHLWGVVGEPKRAATVFARLVPRVMPAGTDSQNPAAIRDAAFVHHYYGSGQVVYIGIDSTWRWRHRAGDKYHHRFWGQLARWAAESKAAAGNEFVEFGPTETDVAAGDDVTVRARWSRSFLNRFANLIASAQVFRAQADQNEKPLATVALNATKDQPLVHEGRLASLPLGDYLVKLTAQGAELGPAEISAPLYILASETPELGNVAANPQLLEQIAQASHGKLLRPDEVHQLPDLLKPPEQRSFEQQSTELWDHWAVMLLFFGLLTAEWVVRKLNGLP